MIVNIDLSEYLDAQVVADLAKDYDVGIPNCFDGVDFDKLSMHDMNKIELFLEKFEDIDLATFEKFFHEH